VVVRIERHDRVGPWFPWALLSVADIERSAAEAGFGVLEAWGDGGRWFSRLERAGARSAGRAARPGR